MRETDAHPSIGAEALGDLRHDLRASLNGIIGFAELMRDGKAGAINDRQGQYLGHILASAERLLAVSDRLLALVDASHSAQPEGEP